MRDAVFLMGDFETPLLQEVCHERLHFIAEKFLRRAGNNEVIRIADQVDLVPAMLRPGGAEALVQQSFQPIQGPICQRGGENPAMRGPFRGGEEDGLIQETASEALSQNALSTRT